MITNFSLFNNQFIYKNKNKNIERNYKNKNKYIERNYKNKNKYIERNYDY
jgi:hypothetical protein